MTVLMHGLLLTTISQGASDLLQELERLHRLREAVEVEADSLEYLEAVRKLVGKGEVCPEIPPETAKPPPVGSFPLDFPYPR
jgi:hypothetical protein